MDKEQIGPYVLSALIGGFVGMIVSVVVECSLVEISLNPFYAVVRRSKISFPIILPAHSKPTTSLKLSSSPLFLVCFSHVRKKDIWNWIHFIGRVNHLESHGIKWWSCRKHQTTLARVFLLCEFIGLFLCACIFFSCLFIYLFELFL